MKMRIPLFLLALTSVATIAFGQTLPGDAIVHPKPDSWPTFHGDDSGRH